MYRSLMVCILIITTKEIAKYRNYVHNGGTLVLNTVYLPYFPAYQQEMTDDHYTVHDGEGTVIVYGFRKKVQCRLSFFPASDGGVPNVFLYSL